LVVSITIALAVVPTALRELERRGLVKENYRGAMVSPPSPPA
jgi:DNA-binding GntR family transcriptional regulator